MEAEEYEDDYSICQTTCIICGTNSFLLDANYSSFHKICARCREVNFLNEKRECRECNSKVKVLKSVRDENDERKEKENNVYQTVNVPKSSGINGSFRDKNDERKEKEKNGYQTVGVPNRNGINGNDTPDYKCEHAYCRNCKKKNQECPICRLKMKTKCCICNRSVILEKKGDLWFCPYCNNYSLECLACSKFTYRMALKLKCDLCECECTSNKKCSHKFCKIHDKSPCVLCTNKPEFMCKFCNVIDVLCKNSICPYCSIKSSIKFCLLCKTSV